MFKSSFSLLSVALLGATLTLGSCSSGTESDAANTASSADQDGNGSADINGSDTPTTEPGGQEASTQQGAGNGMSVGADNGGEGTGSGTGGNSPSTTTPPSGGTSGSGSSGGATGNPGE